MRLRYLFALVVAVWMAPAALQGQSTAGQLRVSATIVAPPTVRAASEMKVLRRQGGAADVETAFTLGGRQEAIVEVHTAMRAADGALLQERRVLEAGKVAPGSGRPVNVRLTSSEMAADPSRAVNLVFVISPDA